MPQLAVSSYTSQFGSRGFYHTVYWPSNVFLSGTVTIAKWYPGVAVFHGGGWSGGTYADPALTTFCRKLAAYGAIVDTFDYTLASAATRPSLETTLDDLEEALSIVRTYGCTQGKPIAGLGFSAGGHLINLYTQVRSAALPNIVIPISAPADLNLWYAGNAVETFDNMLGGPCTEEMLNAASPLVLQPNVNVKQLAIWGGQDPFLSGMSKEDYAIHLAENHPNSSTLFLSEARHLMENATDKAVAMVAAFIGCTVP